MNFVLVNDISVIPQIQSELSKTDFISLDIETDGLDSFENKIRLIQFKLHETTFIIDIDKTEDRITRYILALLNDSGKTILAFNAKFDLEFIAKNFAELFTRVYDPMTAEIILHAGLNKKYPSLSDLVDKYCNVVLDKSNRLDFVNSEVITQEMLIYSAKDVQFLEEIMLKQAEEINSKKLSRIVKLEMEVLPISVSMKLNGIKLDKEKWLALEEKAKEKSLETSLKFKELALENVDFSKFKTLSEAMRFFGIPDEKKSKVYLEHINQSFQPEFIKEYISEKFNIASNMQVKSVLNNIFDLKLESTAEKNLVKVKHEVIDLLLLNREYNKKASTYGSEFLNHCKSDGKIHAEFNPLGTATGRFSNNGPNLQNIPSEEGYRAAFVADSAEYVLLGMDYDQAELRLLAAVSGETELINAYKNNVDVHKLSATILYEKELEEITKDERKKGKTFNFAVVYGTTEYGLFYNFGIPIDEGRESLDKYFKGLPTLKEFITQGGNIIWEKKYSTTPLGRKRYFEDRVLFSKAFEIKKYEEQVKREGINHIIQGGSADIVKIAMCKVFYGNPFEDKLKILLQIHDEIVCLVHKSVLDDAIEFVKKCMIDAEQPFLGEIPASVDYVVGDCWRK